MKVRTVDAKGRVTVGAAGSVYQQHETEDGTITLTPVKPSFPDKDDPRDVVQASLSPSKPGTAGRLVVDFKSSNIAESTQAIAQLLKALKVDTVHVQAAGLGCAWADLLERQVQVVSWM